MCIAFENDPIWLKYWYCNFFLEALGRGLEFNIAWLGVGQPTISRKLFMVNVSGSISRVSRGKHVPFGEEQAKQSLEGRGPGTTRVQKK